MMNFEFPISNVEGDTTPWTIHSFPLYGVRGWANDWPPAPCDPPT